MKTQPKPEIPHVASLPQDMIELQQSIASLPEPQRFHVMQMFDRVAQSTHRRQRILGLVQEALGQLRLDMKYLLFDLEATRRERDDLRRSREDETGF
ncbi:MAG: transcriptional regulator [Planctomycetota bacterium]|nr:transcriptional regulator [Planctomycetota bacterium]MDA1180282.1 transcriptional regulator [Planctomycetota bacterium]